MRKKAGFSRSQLSLPSVKGEFYVDLDLIHCRCHSSECHCSSVSVHLPTEE